ncbi:MAG: type II secretion system F family protein [Candidatus Nanoarchaeia archaeon]
MKLDFKKIFRKKEGTQSNPPDKVEEKPVEKTTSTKISFFKNFGMKKKLAESAETKEQEKKTRKGESPSDDYLRQTSKKMHSKFDKKKRYEKRRLAKILDESLEKSGYEIRGKAYNKKVKDASVISGAVLAVVLGIVLQIAVYKIHVILLFLILAFTALSALSYILILIGSFIFFDYMIYKRTKEIEEVLPEFLQLASANISAGMPIDRALWFAVRPKFGVLAKEIEDVAKSTMAGEDLEEALQKFTRKYDSQALREAMNLLIEGMRAGGEIGFLLNQIASNMQDIKIMKKEIAASIMSYVIFITAAAIVGAPFLLALSAQLLIIMGSISSSVQVDDSAYSSMFSLNMSADSIDVGDFKIFAVLVLLLTSIFSAMIITAIRKGSTKESIKIIPGFVAVSLIIFFAASALFGSLLGGFFAK